MIPASGHLGILLAASGNRREAESLFREGLAAIPNPTRSDRNGVLNLRGNFAVAKASWGEYREAAEDFRAIVADAVGITDANGESAMPHANLAACYRALGDLTGSEAELRTAMQIAWTHPIGNEARSRRIPVSLAMTFPCQVSRQLASALQAQGRLAEARAAAEEARTYAKKLSQ